MTASSGTAFAIYGSAYDAAAYAGYFDGKIYASSANAGIKNFVIDHPLDPEKKLLRHSSVESPERKNIYDGVGTADAAGEVSVQMPAYFDALNEDFRYQLTALGTPAPNLHVKQELSNGRFVIAGAAPGQRICWLITGNRKDATARANPLVIEEDKPAEESGFFLNPEAHGQPKERGLAAERLRQMGGWLQPPPAPSPPPPPRP